MERMTCMLKQPSLRSRIAEEQPIWILEPQGRWPQLRLHDLWEYRDLLYFLVWRDVKVRYKQTVLGAAWAILQPVLATIVFSIFFGRLAKLPSDGIPYPVFAYVAVVPWQLFAFCLGESASSLVSNQNLIQKVYFPRLVIPLATVLTGLVDFCVAFIVLLVLLFCYGIVPPLASLLLLPVLLIFAITAALSGAVLLSSINAQLGNVGYVIAVEYGFYVFFVLCLLCIVAVLAAERFRSAGKPEMAVAVERSGRALFVVGCAGTALAAWLA